MTKPEQFYNNLRNDREKVQALVEELKAGGFEVYATGTALIHHNYNDIDLVIKPKEGMTPGDIESQLEQAVGSIDELKVNNYPTEHTLDHCGLAFELPILVVDELYKIGPQKKWDDAIKGHKVKIVYDNPNDMPEQHTKHTAPVPCTVAGDCHDSLLKKMIREARKNPGEIGCYHYVREGELREFDGLLKADKHTNPNIINRRELNIGGTKLDITITDKPFELNKEANYVKL